jgi:hypothetical protein
VRTIGGARSGRPAFTAPPARRAGRLRPGGAGGATAGRAFRRADGRTGSGAGRPPIAGWLRGLLVAAATALALLGLAQISLVRTGFDRIVGLRPGSAAAAAPVAEARDGITAGVVAATWISHDENDPTVAGPGYQMPLSMMPGMPAAGEMRLGISLTITNSSTRLRPVDPAAEFVLRDARNGGEWQLAADTFGGLSRLGPDAGVDGVIYFDLAPPADGGRNLYVDWKRAGGAARLAIPLNGAAPTHSHP